VLTAVCIAPAIHTAVCVSAYYYSGRGCGAPAGELNLQESAGEPKPAAVAEVHPQECTSIVYRAFRVCGHTYI
jgi:hypothetical protein